MPTLKLRHPHFLTLALVIGSIGCGAVNSPTPPLAPGYASQADQTFGQTLSALHAFAQQAQIDYNRLTVAQQTPVKQPLNNFIAAVNAADSVYLAFHQGQATQAQVQSALTIAQTNQNSYASAAGVK